jgi:hypothetical protein
MKEKDGNELIQPEARSVSVLHRPVPSVPNANSHRSNLGVVNHISLILWKRGQPVILTTNCVSLSWLIA